MPDDLHITGSIDPQEFIRHQTATPPVDIPPGHTGPVYLPGSGRMVWWTGRVAIGLRHQPQRSYEGMTQSASWVQRLMLAKRRGLATA
jgi:hypothetical protein